MKNVILIMLASLLISSCVPSDPTGNGGNQKGYPVKVTRIDMKNIQEQVRLTASSFYPEKNEVVSPVSGYIIMKNISIGSRINAAAITYRIETPEHRALSSAGHLPDSLFSQSGIFDVRPGIPGLVTDVYKQMGDYVQQGMPLFSLSSNEHTLFKAYIPFEYNSYVKPGTLCMLIFPDGSQHKARIIERTNKVDPVSQAEIFFIRTEDQVSVPEGLNVSLVLNTASLVDAQVLPKSAVLSNETMDAFWVMEVDGNSLAIKVAVIPGIVTADSMQILSPAFNSTDKIIKEGGFGLADSAKVEVKE